MGVIHRDVKPGNVLMDEQGNTYLTDFGLARMLESSQQITGSGVGVGTPAYMAPEQGMGGKVDHRSDIYSLGVVLYEMVTGHVPYEAETPMAVVLKHITEPLPLPRTIAPNVPEAVELVILRALAKEPAHRYQSAGELADALAAATHRSASLDVQPVPASQPVVAQPALASAEIFPQVTKKGFWQKRHVWLALLWGALVVLAALGLIFSRFLGQKPAVTPEPTAPVIQPTTSRVLSPMLTPLPNSTALGGTSGVLWLDGKTGYALVPFSESMLVTQAITIEAWVNYVPRAPKKCGDGAGYCNFMPVVGQSNPSSSIGSYVLAVDNGHPLFGFEPTSIGDVLYRTETLMEPGWHHLAVTHTFGQSSKTQMFLDGQPIAGKWINGGHANEAPYNLARTPFRFGFLTVGPEAYFQGLIDELRIWSVARASDEIRATMNVELTGSEDGLAGYWRFNEPEGAIDLLDSSSNGNNGTLHGGAQILINGTPIQSSGMSAGKPTVERINTFAGPILKAIADRKPDFTDDFSTVDKGWDVGNQDKNEWFAIQDGVARLGVSEKDLAIGHEALNRKNFVLQLDARVAEGEKATQLHVNFHSLPAIYWFHVEINSSNSTWLVKGSETGDLANGSGNVSPIGEMTRIMIVAQGSRVAIYLNGVPVAYLENADFDRLGATGIGLFCESTTEGVCEFDNVKFWNLANVPGLP
jgi:hypothetical protein